tara:strand:- start:2092 stop:3897 length:1806 start_codon:yes stop_codon:yes gene_type:complete
MKKNVFLLILVFLISVNISYAVPDDDEDGVPDDEDRCPNTPDDAIIGHQYGCSCAQKTASDCEGDWCCPSDDNVCTDDCHVVDGNPTCGFVNNDECGEEDDDDEEDVNGDDGGLPPNTYSANCEDEDRIPPFPNGDQNRCSGTPVLTSLSPDSLRTGEILTLYGINLGRTVLFFDENNVMSAYNWANGINMDGDRTQVTVPIPSDLSPGNYRIKVWLSSRKGPPEYEYDIPEVISNEKPFTIARSEADLCSDCGILGLFCDRSECESISGCFFDNVFLFPNNCLPCSGASSCQAYGNDQQSCTDNVCSLGTCNWEDNNCVTQVPVNNLPAPNHQILFGYYYADGRYGDFTSEAWAYTNLYVTWPTSFWNGDSSPNWRNEFVQGLQNAVSNNQDILLCAGCNGGLINSGSISENTIEEYWDFTLDSSAPYWSKVRFVEVAHEENWNRATMESKINTLKSKISSRGLSPKPIGATYARQGILSLDSVNAANLDWVAIEAYVGPPGNSNSQTNVNNLNNYLDRAKARVPSDKEIILIMQSYDRNGLWPNINTLVDLQEPVYLKAYNDPRVVAITMFSYARSGGTRLHQELKTTHLRIAEKIVSG